MVGSITMMKEKKEEEKDVVVVVVVPMHAGLYIPTYKVYAPLSL